MVAFTLFVLPPLREFSLYAQVKFNYTHSRNENTRCRFFIACDWRINPEAPWSEWDAATAGRPNPHRFKTACAMASEKEVADGCWKETLLEAVRTKNLENCSAVLKQNHTRVLNSTWIMGVNGQSPLHVAVLANSNGLFR